MRNIIFPRHNVICLSFCLENLFKVDSIAKSKRYKNQQNPERDPPSALPHRDSSIFSKITGLAYRQTAIQTKRQRICPSRHYTRSPLSSGAADLRTERDTAWTNTVVCRSHCTMSRNILLLRFVSSLLSLLIHPLSPLFLYIWFQKTKNVQRRREKITDYCSLKRTLLLHFRKALSG